MRPLFDVGEEVIVASRTVPEINGYNTVVRHVPLDDTDFNPSVPCDCCAKILPQYGLNGGIARICQCALRKKPEPGGDFESFMDDLKTPIKQPVRVEK